MKLNNWLAAFTGFWLLSFAAQASAKIDVVTTTSDLAALTKAVGGDLVNVTSIAKGYQNPHLVDAKPSFILQLQKAELFVQVGLDLEVWVQPLLDSARNPRIRPGREGYVNAAVGVPLLEVPREKLDRSRGDIHIYGNPHYWTDPENAKIIVNNITAGLKRVDAAHADDYEKNRKAYLAKLDDLLDRTLAKMKPYKGAKIVAYHNSWPYFARRYGLNVVDFIEPKPGIPPTPTHVAELIQTMKREGVKVIIKEPYFSDAVPNSIAKQTGATVVQLPPSVGGEKGTDDYIALIEHNVNKLVAALQRAT